VLENTMAQMCVNQCWKRERNYHYDNEICMGKCLDLAFIYTRVGLSEINQFASENDIR
jgi:hypothetical protein